MDNLKLEKITPNFCPRLYNEEQIINKINENLKKCRKLVNLKNKTIVYDTVDYYNNLKIVPALSKTELNGEDYTIGDDFMSKYTRCMLSLLHLDKKGVNIDGVYTNSDNSFDEIDENNNPYTLLTYGLYDGVYNLSIHNITPDECASITLNFFNLKIYAEWIANENCFRFTDFTNKNPIISDCSWIDLRFFFYMEKFNNRITINNYIGENIDNVKMNYDFICFDSGSHKFYRDNCYKVLHVPSLKKYIVNADLFDESEIIDYADFIDNKININDIKKPQLKIEDPPENDTIIIII